MTETQILQFFRSQILNRRVQCLDGAIGTVEQYEPWNTYGDVLLRLDDGRLRWNYSHALTPLDTLGPLPRRLDVELALAEAMERSCREILDRFVQESFDSGAPRWEGMDWAKVPAGKAFVAALEEVSKRVMRLRALKGENP